MKFLIGNIRLIEPLMISNITRNNDYLSDMMEKYSNLPIVLILILLISGCGTTEIVCEQPENIRSAVETSKIVIPEELDKLSGEKELKIPRASPREPRPENSPCLESPPRILNRTSFL